MMYSKLSAWGSALMILSACAPDPSILATFSDAQVAEAELMAMVARLPEGRRAPAQGEEPTAWVRERVEDIALERFLYQLATDSGLANDQQLMLRSRYRVAQQLAQRQLGYLCPAPDIPEHELRELFQQMVPAGDREWILLRHIFKRVPQTLDAKARSMIRQELTELRRQLQEGASFVEMARLHSDSETAADGGLIGRISRQAPIEPKVLQAAWALENGFLSEVIEVANGFHLLRREESGIEPAKAFEDLRPSLRQHRLGELQKACFEDVFSQAVSGLEASGDGEAVSEKDLALLIGEAGRGDPPGADLAEQVRATFSLASRAVGEGLISPAERLELEQNLLRRTVVEQMWIEQRQAMIAELDEDALREFFAANPGRFATDIAFDVDLLAVTGQNQGRRALHERALALRQQILQGTDFADLARRESAHPSSADGGWLGQVPIPQLRRMLGQEAAAKVAELEDGEISQPLLIHGPPNTIYALVRIRARTPSRQRTFEQARELVTAAIGEEKAGSTAAELRRSLLERMNFRPNPGGIRLQAEAWDSASPAAP